MGLVNETLGYFKEFRAFFFHYRFYMVICYGVVMVVAREKTITARWLRNVLRTDIDALGRK